MRKADILPLLAQIRFQWWNLDRDSIPLEFPETRVLFPDTQSITDDGRGCVLPFRDWDIMMRGESLQGPSGILIDAVNRTLQQVFQRAGVREVPEADEGLLVLDFGK